MTPQERNRLKVQHDRHIAMLSALGPSHANASGLSATFEYVDATGKVTTVTKSPYEAALAHQAARAYKFNAEVTATQNELARITAQSPEAEVLKAQLRNRLDQLAEEGERIRTQDFTDAETATVEQWRREATEREFNAKVLARADQLKATAAVDEVERMARKVVGLSDEA